MKIKQIKWKKSFDGYIGWLDDKCDNFQINYLNDVWNTVPKGDKSVKHPQTRMIWFRSGHVVSGYIPVKEAKKFIQDKVDQFIKDSIVMNVKKKRKVIHG